MFVVCRFVCILVVLVHSIFGCSMLHACDCRTHEHTIHGDASADESHCDHDGHHHDSGDGCEERHDQESAPSVPVALTIASPFCDCDAKGSIDGGRVSNEGVAVRNAVHPAVAHWVAACPGCQSSPCDGNAPGCHSDVGCSFRLPSDQVFEVVVSLVGFLPYSMSGASPQLASRQIRLWNQHLGQGATSDASARCAALCVWRI
ncbi:hypothetical protein FHS27_001014 [Rhodopirellula rubra]|uniref:Uncharacterized protein n=2 Tax=Aporhodopirellula rubra TaxID=980271 RepID=A0A7W5DVB8_9BACT|nr:hypothetical protein [Aporhodopirellula rubra]